MNRITDIFNTISRLDLTNLEIEARISDKIEKKDIDRMDYILSGLSDKIEEENNFVKYDSKGIRKFENFENINQNKYEKKTLVKEFISNSDYLNFYINKEIELPQPNYFNSIFERIRNRKSFVFNNSGARVDLTTITQIESNNTSDLKYEIEIELINPSFLSEYIEFCFKIYQLWLNTDILYTKKDKENVYQFVNSYLTSNELKKKSQYVNKEFFKYNTIIENGPYYISYKNKADKGYLVFLEDQIWIISNNYFNLISEENEYFSESIFECEYTDKDIYIYDCILYEKQKMFMESFNYRLVNIDDTMSIGEYNVSRKRFDKIDYINFFDLLVEYDDMIKKNNDIEGVIFVNDVYFEPVFKYKTEVTLTLKNLVGKNGNVIYKTSDNKSFIGTNEHPLEYVNYKIKISNYDIIEYKIENSKLVPIDLKLTKTDPDDYFQAIDAWNFYYDFIQISPNLVDIIHLVFDFYVDNIVKLLLNSCDYVYNLINNKFEYISFDDLHVGKSRLGILYVNKKEFLKNYDNDYEFKIGNRNYILYDEDDFIKGKIIKNSRIDSLLDEKNLPKTYMKLINYCYYTIIDVNTENNESDIINFIEYYKNLANVVLLFSKKIKNTYEIQKNFPSHNIILYPEINEDIVEIESKRKSIVYSEIDIPSRYALNLYSEIYRIPYKNNFEWDCITTPNYIITDYSVKKEYIEDI